MLINEIITEEIQLSELKVDYSKVKGLKYNGVAYTWTLDKDKRGGYFTNTATGKPVQATTRLHYDLIKQSKGASSQGFIKKGQSALGRATGLTGVGQKYRDDDSAGIFQKAGGVVGGVVGRVGSKIGNAIFGPRSGQQQKQQTTVQDFPLKGDIKSLVDTNGKPIMFKREGGAESSHEFEFKGGMWQSTITGKFASKDQIANLTAQYQRQGTKNDTSDDAQNLQRQVDAGTITVKDQNQITNLYKTGKAGTLNQAYQMWQAQNDPQKALNVPDPKTPAKA